MIPYLDRIQYVHNKATIKKEAAIRSSDSKKHVDGLLDAGSRIIISSPYDKYPMDESIAEITITLLGSENG
jgi:hypothetical protein